MIELVVGGLLVVGAVAVVVFWFNCERLTARPDDDEAPK